MTVELAVLEQRHGHNSVVHILYEASRVSAKILLARLPNTLKNTLNPHQHISSEIRGRKMGLSSFVVIATVCVRPLFVVTTLLSGDNDYCPNALPMHTNRERRIAVSVLCLKDGTT